MRSLLVLRVVSNEHDCFVLVHEDAVFEMPAHRARENDSFQVASLSQHVLNRVAVCHAHNVLLDDRALIQGSRDVMASGTNEFHTTFKCLMIGFCPDESGQE